MAVTQTVFVFDVFRTSRKIDPKSAHVNTSTITFTRMSYSHRHNGRTASGRALGAKLSFHL